MLVCAQCFENDGSDMRREQSFVEVGLESSCGSMFDQFSTATNVTGPGFVPARIEELCKWQ